MVCQFACLFEVLNGHSVVWTLAKWDFFAFFALSYYIKTIKMPIIWRHVLNRDIWLTFVCLYPIHILRSLTCLVTIMLVKVTKQLEVSA